MRYEVCRDENEDEMEGKGIEGLLSSGLDHSGRNSESLSRKEQWTLLLEAIAFAFSILTLRSALSLLKKDKRS